MSDALLEQAFAQVSRDDSLEKAFSMVGSSEEDTLEKAFSMVKKRPEPFEPMEAEGFLSALGDRYKTLAGNTSLAPASRTMALAAALASGDEGDRERIMQALQDEQMGNDPSRHAGDFVSGLKNFSPSKIIDAAAENPADFAATLAIDPLSYLAVGSATKAGQAATLANRAAEVAKASGAVGGVVGGAALARTTLDEGKPNLGASAGEAAGAMGLTAGLGSAFGAAGHMKAKYKEAIGEIQKVDSGLWDAADLRATKPAVPVVEVPLRFSDLKEGAFAHPELVQQLRNTVAPSVRIASVPVFTKTGKNAGRKKGKVLVLRVEGDEAKAAADAIELWATKEKLKEKGVKAKDWGTVLAGRIKASIYEGSVEAVKAPVPKELTPVPAVAGDAGGSVGAAAVRSTPKSSFKEWVAELGNLTGIEWLAKRGQTLDDALRNRATETTSLRNAAKHSPTLRSVIQDILPEAGTANKGADLRAAIGQAIGGKLDAIRTALDPLVKSPIARPLREGWMFGRKLPNSVNDPLFRALHGNFDNASAPVRKAVAEIRKTLDAVFHEVGPVIWGKNYMKKYIPDYMPIMLDKVKLRSEAARAALVKELVKQRVMQAAQKGEKNLAEIARSTEFNLKNSLDEIINNGWLVDPFPARGPFKAHNVESARKMFSGVKMTPELQQFVARDVEHVLQRYVTDAVKTAEWQKVFGKRNRELTQSAFGKDGKLRKGFSEPTKYDKIKAELENNADYLDKADKTLEDLKRMVDIEQGTLRVGDVTKVASVVSAMLHLTTVLGTALAEPLLIAARSHPADFIKGSGTAAASLLRDTGRIFAKIPRSEMERFADITQTVMDDSVLENFYSVAAGEQSALGAARHIYFKVNPIGAWTRMWRIGAARVGIELAKRNAEALNNGATGSRAARLIRELEDIGINVDDAKAWQRDGAPMTTEALLKYKIARGGYNFAEGTIMIPRGAMKPTAHSGPYASLNVLMGYGAMFLNTFGKQIVRDMQRAGWKQAGPVGARVAVAMSGLIAWNYAWNMYKAQMAGQAIDKSFAEKMAMATVSAIGGGYSRVVHTAQAPRYGRDPIAAAVGPFWGDVGQMATGAVQSVQKGDTGPLAGAATKIALSSAKPIIGKAAYDKAYYEALGYSADPGMRAVEKKIEELEKDD